jgi:hypothetical protein
VVFTKTLILLLMNEYWNTKQEDVRRSVLCFSVFQIQGVFLTTRRSIHSVYVIRG